jgi:hypothetical protein
MVCADMATKTRKAIAQEPPDWVARIRHKLAAYRALEADGGESLVEDRPIDPAALEAAEHAWSIRLPEEYRDYLLHVSDGGVGPDNGMAPFAEAAMPKAFPRIKVTVTSKAKAGKRKVTGAAKTGKRRVLARPPDPGKPFLVRDEWVVHDATGKLNPLPVPKGANPYDGCVVLTDMGCGYFSFLVVHGERAGEVWLDYTAAMSDAVMQPSGAHFLAWLEAWLDGSIGFGIVERAREALERGEGERAPQHDLVVRHEGVVALRAGDITSAIQRATLDAYLGRRDDAHAALAIAEGIDAKRPALRQVRRWLYRAAFAAADGTDRAALASAARHDVADVREAVARNAHASDEILLVLAGDTEDSVRRAVARHERASSGTLGRVVEAARARWREGPTDVGLFELEAALRNPRCSRAAVMDALGEALERIGDGDGLEPWVVRAALLHPEIDEATLARLADHRLGIVRHAVAGAKHTSAAVLEALARDPDDAVRLTIAARSELAPALLDSLAFDAKEEVRTMVARHPHASPSVLTRMSADLSSYVTSALAHAKQVPAATRAVLELHPRYYIAPDSPAHWNEHGNWMRSGINPGGPLLFLPLGATSAEARARNTFSHPALPVPLMPPHIEMQYGIGGHDMAGHPWLALSPSLYERLARHSYNATRQNIARRADLPAALVAELARDRAEHVRGAIARRDDVPPQLWAPFVDDKSAAVREAAAMSAAASPDVLARLAADREPYVRRGVLRNAATNAELVDALAHDAKPEVRMWAALHACIAPASLARMRKDRDDTVKKWATWRTRVDEILAA